MIPRMIPVRWWWTDERVTAWIEANNPAPGTAEGLRWAARQHTRASVVFAESALWAGVVSAVAAVVAIVSAVVAALLFSGVIA